MTTINIKGPIIENGQKWVYDWFDEDSTCPNDVVNALPQDRTDVSVIINSGGGYVDQGNEIYTALKMYSGKVTTIVIKAASAASVIAMAGDTVQITPVGQIMIHNVSAGAQGDYNTMDKASEVLKKANKSISTSYQIKTGLSEEELLNLMNEETWLTAEEAKEKGFADEILFQDETAIKLVASHKELLPLNIVQKMQEYKNSNKLEAIPKVNEGLERDALEKAIEAAVNKAVSKAVSKIKKEEEPKNVILRFLF